MHIKNTKRNAHPSALTPSHAAKLQHSAKEKKKIKKAHNTSAYHHENRGTHQTPYTDYRLNQYSIKKMASHFTHIIKKTCNQFVSTAKQRFTLFRAPTAPLPIQKQYSNQWIKLITEWKTLSSKDALLAKNWELQDDRNFISAQHQAHEEFQESQKKYNAAQTAMQNSKAPLSKTQKNQHKALRKALHTAQRKHAILTEAEPVLTWLTKNTSHIY